MKVAQIKKTPSGTFLIKAILKDGGATPVTIIPANPTAAYATNFRLGTGDEYCGGTAGATPNPNDAATFKVSNDGAPGACIFPCGPCCNGDGFLSFSSINAPSDCGDIRDQSGALLTNLSCSGYYVGGAGNVPPLPWWAPDLLSYVASITSCTGQLGTLGATTSTQTGSTRNCTSPGCTFGAPLAVPNPLNPPASFCVLSEVQTGLSGTVDCESGATDLALPLDWIVYLGGDTDPGTPGVQPCPRCRVGICTIGGASCDTDSECGANGPCTGQTCVGGPNNGMTCTPGPTGFNPSYPTSHDCPLDPMLIAGTVPIDFALSSGTVSWTATVATNDTGDPASTQTLVFSGYCRDTNDTGAFESPSKQCRENGMAVGTPCAEPYESCEQRLQGAFGPNGTGVKTITAIGNAMSLFGGPGAATLVSVFSLPPGNPIPDVNFILPGPGAVALPGTAETCAVANPCP